MICSIAKKAEQGRTLLYTEESDRETKGKRNQQVNAKANRGKSRTEEPETLAQTLALRRYHTARGPKWREQELYSQKDEGCHYE